MREALEKAALKRRRISASSTTAGGSYRSAISWSMVAAARVLARSVRCV